MEKNRCIVSDCAGTVISKNLCHLHYYRQLNGRPIEATHRLKRNYGKCCVDSCENQQRVLNMCSFHYNRSIRGKKLTDPRIRKAGEGSTHSSGYIVVAGKQQHRIVMEEHLGRKLEDHENVHHINGVRSDNRIENLELWSTKQPPGQRVEEKIKWARELLEFYSVNRFE